LKALSSGLDSLICGGHRSMKRGEIAHHALVLLLLHCLRMLTEIVKMRKLISTMTAEWAFAGVFSADEI
jgi:hypothetical protein